MSAPTPVSREYMRSLKAKKDETQRLAEVENQIKHIYNQALNAAATSLDTSYRFELPDDQYAFIRSVVSLKKEMTIPHQDFFRTNIYDILRGLQCLFPDCKVERVTLARAQDGKMYDISKLGDKVLPFINRLETQDYIIIDWS